MKQNKNLPALLALKPTIAWDVVQTHNLGGNSSRHRFVAGSNWLSVSSYGRTICRLSGLGALQELYKLTSRCLKQKKSNLISQLEQEVVINGQSIYISTHKWRCQLNGEPYIPLHETLLTELNDWLALVCGDLGHKAREGWSHYRVHCVRRDDSLWLQTVAPGGLAGRLCLTDDIIANLLEQLAGAASHPGGETIVVNCSDGRVEIIPAADDYHANINLHIKGQQFCCTTSKQDTLLLAAEIRRLSEGGSDGGQ